MDIAAQWETSQAADLALGEEIIADPTLDGLERLGRPLTNREIAALLLYRQHVADDPEECCGIGMRDDGWCEHKRAMCPLFKRAMRIEREMFSEQAN